MARYGQARPAMTVKQFVEFLLKNYPAAAEVWYIDNFYGELDRKVEEFDIEKKNGKVVIGCDY